ncbi:hypothetical protein [Taibaiella koreensis]|uniref:hypothetical protein n=1 Tax=Taibaiella koreensis TaxID=1268548 RepID=UPI000E59E5A0|nr:hypothetical protein [Taibaiella koreensis]
MLIKKVIPLLPLFLLWMGSIALQAQTGKAKLLPETANQEDLPANEYLQQKLQPIRDNFKRINSTTRWSRIKKIDLPQTGEGGIATFYYQKGKLEKIVSRQFGETFQQLNEYYLLNGQLSFVLERYYRYNRPIYYDSTAMKAANDTEAFAIDSSEIEEDRSYFERGTLLHLVNNQDCGAPFAADYLKEEQQRILADYKRLRQLK